MSCHTVIEYSYGGMSLEECVYVCVYVCVLVYVTSVFVCIFFV